MSACGGCGEPGAASGRCDCPATFKMHDSCHAWWRVRTGSHDKCPVCGAHFHLVPAHLLRRVAAQPVIVAVVTLLSYVAFINALAVVLPMAGGWLQHVLIADSHVPLYPTDRTRAGLVWALIVAPFPVDYVLRNGPTWRVFVGAIPYAYLCLKREGFFFAVVASFYTIAAAAVRRAHPLLTDAARDPL